ncbi:hypothetical protein NG751_04065 [Aliarcobacter cryaerophilus]|uniref:hypothetical protein n=1 Tax=Aliarcobacter cryaerophilus TaxID=28198 RepID=UPI003DA5141D
MGKSEILMLLAGVVLSIMLAMIAIPMFSSGKDMADKQQVQQELLAIKSAIPLIKALEGEEYSGTPSVGKITATSIVSNMEGFVAGTVAATDVKGKSGLANFKIEDNDSTNKIVTVTVTVPIGSNVKLNELSRLDKICDGAAPTSSATSLTCKINR